ncbi:hypothetical protein ACQ4LE_000897 [Meloidogyne hapla]
MKSLVYNAWTVCQPWRLIELSGDFRLTHTKILAGWQVIEENPTQEEFSKVLFQRISVVMRLLKAILALDDKVLASVDEHVMDFTVKCLVKAMEPKTAPEMDRELLKMFRGALDAAIIRLEATKLDTLSVQELGVMKSLVYNAWTVCQPWRLNELSGDFRTHMKILAGWQVIEENPTQDEFSKVLFQRISVVVRLLKAILALDDKVLASVDEHVLVFSIKSLVMAMEPKK